MTVHPHRPGHPFAGQPGCHRWPRAAAPRPAAVPGLPVRHLLRQRHRPTGSTTGYPGQPDRRPVVDRTGPALPAVHRQRGGRHLPRAARAEVRQLPQHHPGRPARGVGAGGGRGGPLGPGPAPRPGPGDRVRHRRLGLQRAGAAGGRLPVDDHGAAPHRPGRLRRLARSRRWPPGWPRSGPAAGPTCCSSGRSRPTRASTTWSRRWPPTGASTTRRPACTWWAEPSATEYRDGRRAVRRRAGPGRRGRDRRLGHPRGADRLLRGLPTSSSASPTTRGSACRCSRRCTTGCPIVAYTNTAVPETVEQAGLILPDKEPVRVAAAIDRVVRGRRAAVDAGRGGRRAGRLVRPAPGPGRVRDRPRGSLRGVTAAAAAVRPVR